MKPSSLARELSHPLSLAWALVCISIQHHYRREGQLAREYAESVVSLAEEHGFPLFSAWGTVCRGWALAEQGRIEEGIAQPLQSRTAFQVMEIGFSQSYLLALLAEAYGKGGQTDAGLQIIAEALDGMQNTGQHHYEPELYRLKGELTLAQSSVQRLASSVTNPQSLAPNPQAEAEAEECFWKAIEVARKQEAKSLELRAVMSLSRLWQQQGKKEEARQMLAEIYNWFTEGFDTKDLQDAKALLAELS